MELEVLGKWILFAILLVVLTIGIGMLLGDKGGSLMEGLRSLIRLGR